MKKLLITATIAAFGAAVSAQAIGPKKHAYAWSRWAGWPPVRGQTAKAPRHPLHRHDAGRDIPVKYKAHHKTYKIKTKRG